RTGDLIKIDYDPGLNRIIFFKEAEDVPAYALAQLAGAGAAATGRVARGAEVEIPRVVAAKTRSREHHQPRRGLARGVALQFGKCHSLLKGQTPALCARCLAPLLHITISSPVCFLTAWIADGNGTAFRWLICPGAPSCSTSPAAPAISRN